VCARLERIFADSPPPLAACVALRRYERVAGRCGFRECDIVTICGFCDCDIVTICGFGDCDIVTICGFCDCDIVALCGFGDCDIVTLCGFGDCDIVTITSQPTRSILSVFTLDRSSP
jgi:hypothetical protein